MAVEMMVCQMRAGWHWNILARRGAKTSGTSSILELRLCDAVIRLDDALIRLYDAVMRLYNAVIRRSPFESSERWMMGSDDGCWHMRNRLRRDSDESGRSAVALF